MDHGHEDERVVLCDECTGQWLVRTETGTLYVLDLDAQTQTRVPDPERVDVWLAAGGHKPAVEFLPLGTITGPALRRDHETLALAALGSVRIGEPLFMMLDLFGNLTAVTMRITSRVTEATPLA